jgi:pyrroloquinoline quinone biosynthesis protein D
MSAPVVIGDTSMPRLVRGTRLQFDKQRDQWIIQAPERVFVLDAIATEILQRCTGEATVSAIVDDLAGKFNAPRDLISRDVNALRQGFADKGLMTA